MADLSDISLVTQVAVFHNKKAFDQLVRKYQSPVRRFFLNQTLGDEQLSDDLAQETFIKASTMRCAPAALQRMWIPRWLWLVRRLLLTKT